MSTTLSTTTPEAAQSVMTPVVTEAPGLLDPDAEYTEQQVAYAIVASAKGSAASDWVATYGAPPASGEEVIRYRALVYLFLNRAWAAYTSDTTASIGERLHHMAFAMALLLVRRQEQRALLGGRSSLS